MGDERIFTKCAWRLIPLMLALYFVNYLDRVNVAFASLTMVRDLNFSPSEYGFGAGILFVGYFAFHVPANLILERMGARRWMFSILLVWGALSAATALVQGPISFFILRFVLGAAEAGLFPGLDLLSDAVVSARVSRALCRELPDRPAAGVCHRLADFGVAARIGRPWRTRTAGSGCSCSKDCRRACWRSSC